MMEEEKPLDEVYFFWMERAIKAQRKAANQLFRDMGLNLTSDQWTILKRLNEEDGRTQRDLALSLYKDPASLTRILDLLEKENYVRRIQSDRRSFKIVLTQEGRRLVEKVLPEAVKYRQIGLDGISQEDLKIMKKVLTRLAENFEKDNS